MKKEISHLAPFDEASGAEGNLVVSKRKEILMSGTQQEKIFFLKSGNSDMEAVAPLQWQPGNSGDARPR
jgi:hypothetical protein